MIADMICPMCGCLFADHLMRDYYDHREAILALETVPEELKREFEAERRGEQFAATDVHFHIVPVGDDHDRPDAVAIEFHWSQGPAVLPVAFIAANRGQCAALAVFVDAACKLAYDLFPAPCGEGGDITETGGIE